MNEQEEQLVESLRSLDTRRPFDPAATTAGVVAGARRQQRRRQRAKIAAAAVVLGAGLWAALPRPDRGPADSTSAAPIVAAADAEDRLAILQQEIERLQEQLRLAEQLERLAAAQTRNEQLVAQLHDDLYSACYAQAVRQLATQ